MSEEDYENHVDPEAQHEQHIELNAPSATEDDNTDPPNDDDDQDADSKNNEESANDDPELAYFPEDIEEAVTFIEELVADNAASFLVFDAKGKPRVNFDEGLPTNPTHMFDWSATTSESSSIIFQFLSTTRVRLPLLLLLSIVFCMCAWPWVDFIAIVPLCLVFIMFVAHGIVNKRMLTGDDILKYLGAHLGEEEKVRKEKFLRDRGMSKQVIFLWVVLFCYASVVTIANNVFGNCGILWVDYDGKFDIVPRECWAFDYAIYYPCCIVPVVVVVIGLFTAVPPITEKYVGDAMNRLEILKEEEAELPKGDRGWSFGKHRLRTEDLFKIATHVAEKTWTRDHDKETSPLVKTLFPKHSLVFFVADFPFIVLMGFYTVYHPEARWSEWNNVFLQVVAVLGNWSAWILLVLVWWMGVALAFPLEECTQMLRILNNPLIFQFKSRVQIRLWWKIRMYVLRYYIPLKCCYVARTLGFMTFVVSFIVTYFLIRIILVPGFLRYHPLYASIYAIWLASRVAVLFVAASRLSKIANDHHLEMLVLQQAEIRTSAMPNRDELVKSLSEYIRIIPNVARDLQVSVFFVSLPINKKTEGILLAYLSTAVSALVGIFLSDAIPSVTI